MAYELNGYKIKWDCAKSLSSGCNHKTSGLPEQKIYRVIDKGFDTNDGDYVYLCNQQIKEGRAWGWSGGLKSIDGNDPRYCKNDKQLLSQVEVLQYNDLCTTCHLTALNA